jgi:hypothetical protein
MARTRIALLPGLVLISACSTTPPPVSPTSPQASQPAAGTATAPVPAPPVAPADNPAQRLLSEAAAACGAGDTAGGLVTLDRALRIAPRHAGLYAAMARCHALAGNAEAAAAAAERGLLYCRGAECRALARYADD